MAKGASQGSRINRCGKALSAAVVASGHLQSDFMADAGVVNGGASTEVLALWGNRGSSREGRQQSHPGQAQARRGVKQTCSDPDSSTPPPLLIPAIAQETRGKGKDDRAVNRMDFALLRFIPSLTSGVPADSPLFAPGPISGNQAWSDVGVAPYARPGLSPWYDTTDIVVPQKSCRLLLALPYPKKFQEISFPWFPNVVRLHRVLHACVLGEAPLPLRARIATRKFP